jgi:hypothetical protein
MFLSSALRSRPQPRLLACVTVGLCAEISANLLYRAFVSQKRSIDVLRQWSDGAAARLLTCIDVVPLYAVVETRRRRPTHTPLISERV